MAKLTEPKHRWTVTSVFTAELQHAYDGLWDAFCFIYPILVLYKSPTIRRKTCSCIFLNGVVFLGSILLLRWLGLPLVHFLCQKIVGMERVQEMGTWTESFLDLLFNIFWLYPVYCISFILNSLWYQEIADRSYRLQVGKPAEPKASTYKSVLKMVADEIYRTLLFLNYILLATLVYYTPYIGPFISFLNICWLYSYYSFEYCWINKGWSLQHRLHYFQQHWAYFAGYGMPCTIFTFFFPQFVSAGIFALLFPMVSLLKSFHSHSNIYFSLNLGVFKSIL